MMISDLSYCESAEANVVGGYYFGQSSTTNISENLTINKLFKSTTLISGNLAGAEAEAFASGPNTATQAVSLTSVVQGQSSGSNATSISGTSGFCWVCW